MSGPGTGPDRCIVCGEDASHTMGRHCSSECAYITIEKDDADQSTLGSFGTTATEGK